MRPSAELLKGATDTALLAVLAIQACHGYELAKRLRQRSDGVFHLGEGTLYPRLYKLESKGWISGRWEAGAGKRRRRVYRLTQRGRGQLDAATRQWREFSQGMKRVLGGIAHA